MGTVKSVFVLSKIVVVQLVDKNKVVVPNFLEVYTVYTLYVP